METLIDSLEPYQNATLRRAADENLPAATLARRASEAIHRTSSLALLEVAHFSPVGTSANSPGFQPREKTPQPVRSPGGATSESLVAINVALTGLCGFTCPFSTG